MHDPIPPAPEFGAVLPVRSSADALSLLAARRSSSPQHLGAPAPEGAELDGLLRLAARVPDHGKMTPWRFVVLRGEGKAAFVERLRGRADHQPNPERARQSLFKIAGPPLCVAVLSVPRHGAKPVWEQQSSAAAVCTTLLIAASAMGYGGNWITDWYGEDPEVLRWLGVDPDADPAPRLAGWILLGTPTEPPLERARPDVTALTREWRG